MTTISAKSILASRNNQDPDPDRVLHTVLCRYPRPIHAELMTHRVLSRNAASSRAIPVRRMIQSVMDDPYIPLVWGANKPGMQAGADHREKVALDDVLYTREEAWLEGKDNAIKLATAFADAGYHKQMVNRILEPYSHITVLISSTEWDNFFALRDHEEAEPHIQMLARAIREAIEGAEVKQFNGVLGEAHLPFITPEELTNPELKSADHLIRSVARCASTSYATVEGYDMDMDKAHKIYNKLIASNPIHASPLEHIAMPDRMVHGLWASPRDHRNFVGWCQFRAHIDGGYAK